MHPFGQDKNLVLILDSSYSLTLHIQSLRQYFWFYFIFLSLYFHNYICVTDMDMDPDVDMNNPISECTLRFVFLLCQVVMNTFMT